MRLFIGQPVCGDVPVAHFACMANLWQNPPCQISIRQVGKDTPVADARNRLIKTEIDRDGRN